MLLRKKENGENTVKIQEKEIDKASKELENGDKYTEDTEDNRDSTIKNVNLFILCDNATNKFKEYIEETEIGAIQVYSSIDKARDELMLEFDEYRIVIVDTGTGKFSGIAQRRDIVDILGMMDDGCTASIFYTDEALRSDIKQHMGKNIGKVSMTRYNGTADMILELTKLGEKYTGKYKADYNETKEHNILVRRSKANERFAYGAKPIGYEEIVINIHDGKDIKSFNDYV